MDDGLFERFPVQEIYAYHTASALRPGELALNYGAMQAAADAFTLTITGKRRPWVSSGKLQRSDCGCSLHYYRSSDFSFQKRKSFGFCSSFMRLYSFGEILWHKVLFLILARLSELLGPFKPETRDLIEKRLKEVAESTAAAFGCTAVLDYDRKYPPLINSEEQAKPIADVGAELVGKKM